MTERSEELVRQLNGGHRRRVEIARALLHCPDVLLLDEPTVGLDPATRQTIVEHIHTLARDNGTAVLWATHLVDELRDHDGLLALTDGRLVANDTVRNVIASSGCEDLASAYDHLFAVRAAT
jgi:ABC-2 type transport system ATP-binding protein